MDVCVRAFVDAWLKVVCFSVSFGPRKVRLTRRAKGAGHWVCKGAQREFGQDV